MVLDVFSSPFVGCEPIQGYFCIVLILFGIPVIVISIVRVLFWNLEVSCVLRELILYYSERLVFSGKD